MSPTPPPAPVIAPPPDRPLTLAARATSLARAGLGVALGAGGKGARFAVRRARRPLNARWRARVLAAGVDDTAASAARSALIIAPHPDDETIGCGATIARKRAAGTAVDVAIVCDGRHSHRSERITPQQLADIRAAESREACQLLGVQPDRVRLLGFEELTLWRALDEVADRLAALIDEVAPDEILVVSDQDWHTDHQATHIALLRAVQRSGYRGRVAAYPVWFWADGPWRTVPVAPLGRTWRELLTGPRAARRLPRATLVHTEQYGERKRAAFACYRSQGTNLTGEAGWATFAADWIEPYLGTEVFFPVDAAAVARARLDPRQQVLGESVAVAVGLEPVGPTAGADKAAAARPEPAVGRRLAGASFAAGEPPTGEADGLTWKPAPATDDGVLGALLQPDVPVGMVRAEFETGARFAPDGRAGVLFRQDGAGGGWRLLVGSDGVELSQRAAAGRPWTVEATARGGAAARQLVTVTVVDDGAGFECRRDGEVLFGGVRRDDRHAGERACGPLSGPSRSVWPRRFEVFGRP